MRIRFIVSVSVCSLLLLGKDAIAQTSRAPNYDPQSEISTRLRHAQTVFLGNQGTDENWAQNMIGGSTGPYNALYASLAQWGRFRLVDSPRDADLVFEIYGEETFDTSWVQDDPPSFGQHEINTWRHAWFHLRVNDPSTGLILTEIKSPAGFASTRAKGEKNFYQSIKVLIEQIKVLVDGSPGGLTDLQIPPPPGPVPPLVRNAKRILLENHATNPSSSRLFEHFREQLIRWGYYTFVSTPNNADVILGFANSGIRVVVVDPVTNVTLMTVDDPAEGRHREMGEKYRAIVAQGLVDQLKRMAGQP